MAPPESFWAVLVRNWSAAAVKSARVLLKTAPPSCMARLSAKRLWLTSARPSLWLLMAPPPPVVVTVAVLVRKLLPSTDRLKSLKIAPPEPSNSDGSPTPGARAPPPGKVAPLARLAAHDTHGFEPESAKLNWKMELVTMVRSLVASAPPAPPTQLSLKVELSIDRL